MKRKNKYLIQFLNFIESEGNKGKKLISIRQQERNGINSFKIHPIYLNYSLKAINVEYAKLPGDTIIPIDVFKTVINSLSAAPDKTMKKGNAQNKNNRIGNPGLEEDTLEAIVAINNFDKNRGQSVYRRIPIISNILVSAGICENIRKGSRLKLID